MDFRIIELSDDLLDMNSIGLSNDLVGVVG